MAVAVLCFVLAEQAFALPAARVRECLPLPLLHRRAGQPPHVAGHFSLGGATVTVLDLASLLDLRPAGAVPLLEAGGLYRHLILLDGMALLVDRVTDLATTGSAAPAEPGAGRWQNGCVAAWLGLGGEPVALLDPDRILREHERAQLRRIEAEAERRAAGWLAPALPAGSGDAG